MTTTTTGLVLIESIECHNCHAVYGLSAKFKEQARHDKSISWHCPHCDVGTIFTTDENTKLKAQIARLQTNAEHAEAAAQRLRDTAQHLRNSRAVVKGHLTRVCRRVKAGVCPCCNRTFESLARHMETKHPEYKEPAA